MPERSQGGLELLGRAAVPVGRVLEPVRVEVERAREVALGVLLGHAEVDVEQDEPARRAAASGGRRRAASRSQPMWTSLLVVRAAGRAAAVGSAAQAVAAASRVAHVVDARARRACRHRGVASAGAVAVDHDVPAGGDALLARSRSISASSTVSSQAAGNDDRARDVAAARLAVAVASRCRQRAGGRRRSSASGRRVWSGVRWWRWSSRSVSSWSSVVRQEKTPGQQGFV